MSSANYRRLLTNLPSMAAVVNTFQSTDVQIAVYRVLVDALLEATADEIPQTPTKSTKAKSRANEVELDLVEGDNIHSIAAD